MIEKILNRFGYAKIEDIRKMSFKRSFVRYMTMRTTLSDFDVYTIVRSIERRLDVDEYRAISLVMSYSLDTFNKGYGVDKLINMICESVESERFW